MVIKSKNSRKVKIIKIISVILAVISGTAVLFSGAFIAANNTMLEEPGNTPEVLLDSQTRHEPGLFVTTAPMGYQLLDDIIAVTEILRDYGNEDYFQNVYLKQQRARLEQERDNYISDRISEYGFQYQDYYSNEYTTYASEPAEEATAADGGYIETTASYEETTGSDIDYERARAYWSQEFDLEGKYNQIENDIRNKISDLNSLDSLKIYAVNNANGFVYTNMSEENPIQTIQAYSFSLCYHTKSNEVERFSKLQNEVTNTRLENSFDIDGDMDIYLGIDTVNMAPRTVGDRYGTYCTSFELCIKVLDVVQPLLPVAGIIFLVCLVLAIILAGHGPLPEPNTELYRRKILRFGGTISGREPVLRNFLDAIPNDVHLILGLGLSFGCSGYGILWSSDRFFYPYLVLSGTLALLMFSLTFTLFFVELCMSISRNAKTGHYWQRTLLASMGRGFKRLGKWFKYQFSPLGHHFKSLPRYILRLLIAYFIVMIPLSLIPFLPIFINIFVVLFLWRSMASLDRLMKYAHEIQSGNLNVTIDTAKFPKWMVPFAQDIIHLRDGMQAAVDEALKSERLKTELITNVSHDLKTPLTSIINYTGLLAKCDIPDQQAQDYIAVLQNKSDRLKHLIEDLVEASKASTGNIEFHPIRLNLYEMAVQAVGENEDALANQGVTVVINEPEQHPVVQADSQKTWRVVENLLSNVRKYSVPGTRAYIDVRTEGAFGVLTVKNISREELNISPEELMERFVRGDESRSTEGSGLGLSIAQNLCEKQGGQFTIEIDGDLFKAIVRLPLAPEQSTIPEPIQTPPDPAQP